MIKQAILKKLLPSLFDCTKCFDTKKLTHYAEATVDCFHCSDLKNDTP